MTDFPGAALLCTSTNGFPALSHTWSLKNVSLSGGASHIGHYRKYPTLPHPPWPGLQLKFSFFGSVLFKSNKVVSFKNVILKISKRLPLYFTKWILLLWGHICYISSFLSGNLHPPPGSETSLSLKKKLSKFTDIKASFPPVPRTIR